MNTVFTTLDASQVRDYLIDMLAIANCLSHETLPADLRASYSLALQIMHRNLFNLAERSDNGVKLVFPRLSDVATKE